ncbi:MULTISPECIES: M14 family metallopeptidase [Streptomyces]|uniref:M14 family metallopeptidase n=1 Tax=Streptomyces TaxID=1883 RepID=UPI00163D3554|nr:MULTISPECIES: M14 family metallopeptidase [Streptomyces]MBC2877189.1 immune inhibitor A [Streptomyces sp. TYQ1024]UBI39456.1 immune inhibitor A [Streptomyces mobaraensis]UKW32036.1 immune inhibitor A [Streptomyces sp. TYQ1024]
MRRRTRATLVAATLLLGGVTAAPFAHATPFAPARPDTGAADTSEAPTVWTGEVTQAQVPLLLKAGVDGHELGRPTGDRAVPVELYLTRAQADGLRGQGVKLTEKQLSPRARERLKPGGDGVFRPYSGPKGLQREVIDTGRAHPGLTKVVSIGKTVRGQDILALKLSKDAARSKDGSKPAVLYMSNQHAREWITPETTRRLMHHYLDRYGKDPRITRLVDRTELWFVLSANPDGYDHTFKSPETRFWRKNLRDNNGDGKITAGDGVDLNRNFPYKWGYDNEGSSPDPDSETYRGPAPASEPETRALDAFEKRVRFSYAVNYHSAGEMLLYGVGWQVATPTPDDVLLKSLAGTPEKSAIPGYRPQLSSELYTTNGEADGHAANVNGTLMFTPEMSTCRTASRADTSGRWDPADCPSEFAFPDDKKLIQAEFAKNLPFALSVAETAARGDRPVSVTGLSAPDFTPHAFGASFARGTGQTVAVTARKSVRDKKLNYRVDGGKTHTAVIKPWKGGKRYGGHDNVRFDEYRGTVPGAREGARVEVWFTGRTAEGKATRSKPFTYTVWHRPEADTLVIADEGGTAPARHAVTYTEALSKAGRKGLIWDVARDGTPDPLGVLSHFRTVLWYTGDNKPSGGTLLAVRDHINEGGKLITMGERAGGESRVGRADTDDFSQYYLGAYTRTPAQHPKRFAGTGPLAGVRADLADAPGNPLDAAGTYVVTSDALRSRAFPQFRSAPAGDYPGVRGAYEPWGGDWMANAAHKDRAWMRLARTVDLTGVRASAKPALGFRLSVDTEPEYDQVIVEAHTVGRDDWTTLRDTNGGTADEVPQGCSALVALHPFLKHYLTVAGDDCAARGTSGVWHRFTGSTQGWHAASFDLSSYAGKKVELAVSYVTDSGTGRRGALVDEAAVTGADRASEGFESGSLGTWKAPGAPAGSARNIGDWAASRALAHSSAAVVTPDTALLGFGLEHVRDGKQRVTLLRAALRAVHG